LTAFTETFAVPLFPSLVAVIVALPAATAFTRPVPLTVATPVLELDHVMARPVRTFPLASLVTAVAWVDCPAVSVDEFNVTATEATGTADTETVAWPVTLSLVAMMFALPAPTALTEPLAFTVATAVLELDQVRVLPVRTLPLASFRVAVA
jgi:hypothetical protein